MKPQVKATLLNLLCAGILFVIFMYGIGSLLALPYIPLLFGSAVLASILTPKFGVVRTKEGEKVVMKWFGYTNHPQD
ncbi:hypothetical protein ACFQ1M_01905 [Sungkyunkwania multivorans]|uniref:Uncharacterized protein n=1 Tax=Sungkyunkwania multivorans TaxID=1173618 RepID=A0ABW3CTF1_9FLAO